MQHDAPLSMVATVPVLPASMPIKLLKGFWQAALIITVQPSTILKAISLPSDTPRCSIISLLRVTSPLSVTVKIIILPTAFKSYA